MRVGGLCAPGEAARRQARPAAAREARRRWTFAQTDSPESELEDRPALEGPKYPCSKSQLMVAGEVETPDCVGNGGGGLEGGGRRVEGGGCVKCRT